MEGTLNLFSTPTHRFYSLDNAPPFVLTSLVSLSYPVPKWRLVFGVPQSKRMFLSSIRETVLGMCEIDCKSLALFSTCWTSPFNIFNVFLTFTKCLASFGQSLFKAFYWKYPWVVPKHGILFQSILNFPEEGIVNVAYCSCQSRTRVLSSLNDNMNSFETLRVARYSFFLLTAMALLYFTKIEKPD